MAACDRLLRSNKMPISRLGIWRRIPKQPTSIQLMMLDSYTHALNCIHIMRLFLSGVRESRGTLLAKSRFGQQVKCSGRYRRERRTSNILLLSVVIVHGLPGKCMYKPSLIEAITNYLIF